MTVPLMSRFSPVALSTVAPWTRYMPGIGTSSPSAPSPGSSRSGAPQAKSASDAISSARISMTVPSLAPRASVRPRAGAGEQRASGAGEQPARGAGPLRYGDAVPSSPRSGAGPIASAPRPALAATLLVALGLRLDWGLAVAGDSHAAPSYDGAWYDRVARDLVAGAGVRGVDGRPTAFFPPGYPAFLAAFYAVFGAHPALPKILNAALATLTCLLTYTAGRAAYGWRVGIAAAGLVAASPGDVFYAGVTLSEPLLTCALTGLVLAFLLWNREAAPRSRWLSLGLLLGAASLVRGIALPFAAVPIAAWLVERGPGRETWLRSGLLALGIALAVAPWTLRNHLRLGYPILIASDGANALLIAHSPIADGSQSLDVWDWRGGGAGARAR